MTPNRTEQHEPTIETVTPPRLEQPAKTEEELTAFIGEVVEDADAEGVVVNLSGGIDSTVSATLAVEALGSDRVSGLILPADANSADSIHHARRVAEELLIEERILEIQPLLDRFIRTVTAETREVSSGPLDESSRRVTAPIKHRDDYRTALGNVAARVRMQIAYFEANTTGRLVLGTGNRTELLLGYFTKYGDGGVDLLPIGDLYKTQVRDLGRHLDIPDAIIEKPPTAGLWDGQTDENELGAPYETIDTVLRNLVDRGMSVDEVASVHGFPDGLTNRLAEMVTESRHKRNPPPTPATRVSDPTVG